MNKFRRLTIILVLAALLGLSAFTGHASACDPTDPGETHTPPCVPPPPSANQSAEPGMTGSTAPANDSFDLAIREIAFTAFETALSLF